MKATKKTTGRWLQGAGNSLGVCFCTCGLIWLCDGRWSDEGVLFELELICINEGWTDCSRVNGDGEGMVCCKKLKRWAPPQE